MGCAQLLDCLVAESLHPRLKLFGAVQLALRVVVQNLDCLGNGGTRLDFVGNCLLLGLHAGKFFDTPLVGFFEVDLGTQELSA